jgi:hypothetical protein
MDLAIDETQELTVLAYPGAEGLFEDVLMYRWALCWEFTVVSMYKQLFSTLKSAGCCGAVSLLLYCMLVLQVA